jgi:uncharacterized protein (TIGR02679 family)
VTSPRLEALLGGPALAWLRARARARMSRGAPLTGAITLLDPTTEERSAIERLLGRMTKGQALRVDLDELAAVLKGAELADELAAALVQIDGPVENPRLLEAERTSRWRAVILAASGALGSSSPWHPWLHELDRSGLLRRLSSGDPDEGQALVLGAIAVVGRLPAQAIPLAELAASVLGDGHALDLGEPAGTLVLRAIATRGGFPFPADADERRAAWASVGVLADELSAPALVLNLPALPNNPTGRALALAAEVGEPYRLSTRQLLRTPPTFALARGSTVFACENPSIVAAAANRLGSRARPLLCTEGQPKTALRQLLAQLTAAGIAVAYHGDFDWPGIQIANLLVERFAVRPWRFGPADYLEASAGGPLRGPPVAPRWDEALGGTMRDRGRAVHEEAVVGSLLQDLVLRET